VQFARLTIETVIPVISKYFYQLKNKLPSIEDRGQTDHVTILANSLTLTYDLDFQSPATYMVMTHDPYTCKKQDLR